MQTIANALLVLGLSLALWQYSLIHGKEVAEGQVTALVAYNGAGKNSTYQVVAKFVDHTGQQRNYRSGFGSIATGYDVGDRIRIFFDRDNPDVCGVLSFGYRFGIAWGIFVAGLALWLFVAGAQSGNLWLEKLISTTIRPV